MENYNSCNCPQPAYGGHNELQNFGGFNGSMSWPQVVGLPGEVAASLIAAEKPHLQIETVNGPPWALSQDLRPNRVRILVNVFTNKVVATPTTG
nr:inhibitor of trypsin and hageman factor-like [Ipomoea trifida]